MRGFDPSASKKYLTACTVTCFHFGMEVGQMKKADAERVKMMVYIDPDDRGGLDKLSKKTGAPLTELIRRAVKLYLKTEGK